MVATRRGERVCSPTKTNPDESAGVQATPSRGRRTRRTTTTKQEEAEEGAPVSPQSQSSRATKRCGRASRLHSPTPSTPVDSTHEADESDLDSCCSATMEVEQRTTRRSTRHTVGQEGAEQPLASTPASKPAQRARQGPRSVRKKTVQQSSDEARIEANDAEASVISEVESCSSVVSESKKATRSQRIGSATTRSKAKQQKEDQELSEAESCTSSVSGAQVPTTSRATRSRRGRSALTQPIPMNLDEASEGSQSPALSGRRTRATRGKTANSVVVSEPQSCDSDGFESGPSVTPVRTTRRQGKAKATSAITTDSESELTDGLSQQASGRSTRSRGTPSSSRTGSGNSSQTGRTTRLNPNVLSVVLEKTVAGITEEEQPGEAGPVEAMPMEVDSQASEVTISEMAAEENELTDSKLESTLNEEQDCTVLEENVTLVLEEDEEEGVTTTDLTSEDAQTEEAELIEVGHRGSVIMSVADADINAPASNEEKTLNPTETEDRMTAISMEDENTNAPEGSDVSASGSITVSDSHAEEAEAPCEPAVAEGEQQRELSAEDKDGDASEKAPTEETDPPAEPVEPPCSESVTVTECEGPDGSLEVTEEKGENNEAMEIDEADAHAHIQQPQSEGPGDGPTDGDAAVGEEMEASVSEADAQQAGGPMEAPPSPSEPALTQAEAIQVTSSQTPTVTVTESLETETRDSVIIKKAGGISLLDSSDDEDDVGEEEEEEEEESSGEDGLPTSAEDLPGPSHMAGTASADGLFVIDSQPGLQADKQYYKDGLSTEEEMAKQAEEDEEFVDEDGDDDDEDTQILYANRNPQVKELSSRIDPGLKVKELGGLYINFDGSKSKPVSTSLKKLKEQQIQDEVMKKSVIGPDFEKKDAVPPYVESKQALKLKRKEEREKTTGDGWFNMKAPELTQELKGDLKVLQMRGSMDSKRFYKKNDREGFPKYFQFGTVVDSPVDFYHSRVPKKERKRTMVEELLADAEFRHNNKKKYQQIMMEKAAQGAGKKNKKKSKFHKK